MSEENVDRFMKAAEAFNRIAENATQIEPVDVMDLLGLMDGGIHFEPQQAMLQGSYTGHEGVMTWLVDLAEHYRGGQMEFAEVRDLGDRVLALGALRVTGRGSGIEIEVPLAIVASFQNGLMTRFNDYGDESKALEAAGLSE